MAISKEEKKFTEYITEPAAEDDVHEDFNVALHIEVQLKRTKDAAATNFKISNDTDAIPVSVEEENIRETYPWDYGILTTRLRKRYANFKVSQKYHRLRRELEKDSRYANARVLDPGNPRSAKKMFFSPNIVVCFDEYYTWVKSS